MLEAVLKILALDQVLNCCIEYDEELVNLMDYARTKVLLFSNAVDKSGNCTSVCD